MSGMGDSGKMDNSAQAARVSRMMAELRVAVRASERGVIRAWGARTLRRFPLALKTRVKRVGRVAKTVFVAGVGELIDAASNRDHLGLHLRDRGEAALGAITGATWTRMEAVGGVLRMLPTDPAAAASILFGWFAGILIGSGGLDADGGLPDLDIQLMGIGSHRSVLTHSIVMGAAAEAGILSVLDLALVIHDRLPAGRDALWNELIDSVAIFADALRRGTDVGLALHVGADATVDGFTPYKDLPVALPENGHRLLMGVNALGEADAGLDGLERRSPAAARLARLLLRTT